MTDTGGVGVTQGLGVGVEVGVVVGVNVGRSKMCSGVAGTQAEKMKRRNSRDIFFIGVTRRPLYCKASLFGNGN
jgi:hypothetical protein